MTGASFVLRDTATMLRRNLLHARRYPSLTLLVAAMPVIFYLIARSYLRRRLFWSAPPLIPEGEAGSVE